MYRNGILTFGLSAHCSRILGTRKFVIFGLNGPKQAKTGLLGHLSQKLQISGFPDLRNHVQRSQMVVSHFDTYSNGIKTIYKPKPNSSWIPHNTLTCKWAITLVFPCVVWAQVWTWGRGRRGLITWASSEMDPPLLCHFCSPYNTQQLGSILFHPTSHL